MLTGGGWRWTWLALCSRGAFAVSRPLTNVVAVQDADLDRDEARNGRAIGGRRGLSNVLANEFTHGDIDAPLPARSPTSPCRPGWWRGYADHVAGESSLSDADVAQLEASGRSHPALPYYHGRRRVEAILNDNSGDVDALFTQR